MQNRRYRYLALLLVAIGLMALYPLRTEVDAQSYSLPRVLVTGVDINGQGFPITVIDLANGSSSTLATFGNRPACLPDVFPDGQRMLYELLDPTAISNVYLVNVVSGERQSLPIPRDAHLTCPRIAPDGTAIVWLRTIDQLLDDGTTQHTASLILTDTAGREIASLISHPEIYDVRWSPGGGVLVYNVTTPEVPYPQLYSLPREGQTEPRLIWGQADGLLQDYEWATNGTGLLVAYNTEMALQLAFLTTDCVIGPGDACPVNEIARFPPQATVVLHAAFSPDGGDAVISLTTIDEQSNQPQTDLWIIDVSGEQSPQQITFTPDLVETDAHWSPDGNQIYFIGSQIDLQAETIRGQIYRLDLTTQPPTAVSVFQSGVFSPNLFLWWYE